MSALILTPAQVLQNPQEHLGQTVFVRGYLLIWPGFVVSEDPLIMEFDAVLVETDQTFHKMFWAVEEPDYLPTAVLVIQSQDFGMTVNHALVGYGDLSSRFLLKVPVVVSATLEQNASPDIMTDYVLTNPNLTNPNLVVVEHDDFQQIPERSIFLTKKK